MKIFLAGTCVKEEVLENHKVDYILESFYTIKKWQIPYIKKCKMFLLDSGAFTFMNGNKGKVDFNQYLNDYINFINKYDIKYFFELDIDSVVGYEKVKEMRTVLEKGTGKKCIPVWHKARGLSMATGSESVYVNIKADHACVSARGAKSDGFTDVTNLTGLFRTNSDLRKEVEMKVK